MTDETYDDQSGEMADSWTAVVGGAFAMPREPEFRLNSRSVQYPSSDRFPAADMGADYASWPRSLCGKSLQMPPMSEAEFQPRMSIKHVSVDDHMRLARDEYHRAEMIAWDYAQQAWEESGREMYVRTMVQTTAMRVEDAYLQSAMLDAEEEVWCERQAARGELAGCPETMGCYECGGYDGVTAPERTVVALGPVVNRADPTQTYVLSCTHTVI